jgi:FdhD protein
MDGMTDRDDLPVTVRRVWRVDGGAGSQQEIGMVSEEPLSLTINGRQVAVLMRMPGMEKELAVGFCLSEGLVTRFDDILLVHHCGSGLPVPGEALAEGDESTSRNRVDVQVRPNALREEARLEVVRLIRAGCGAVDVERTELLLPPVAPGPSVATEVLIGLDGRMRAAQRMHQRVGGVHAAALFDRQGELIILCEDVGRHNAVDKAIGHCFLRGIALRDKLLLCSGRLSYEMVTKAVRVGLPVLASVSAPTALAVQIAEQSNLTVIGYLRGSRMTVYTHAERIDGLKRESVLEGKEIGE